MDVVKMYVLGIDFGGGASKATLLSDKGKVIATATAEYQTLTGADGLREQVPMDWFNSTVKNIKSVMSSSGVNPEEIAALCLDAATHTAVLMDDNFNVVRNSVYWTDTRSVLQKKFLEENFGDDIFNKFKHRVDTIWTLPELLWIKETEPKVWSKVKKVTFAKDYVRHLFTGDFVTDYIEAEGSMFFDFDKKTWDEDYLKLLGLSKNNLPEVVSPADIVGFVTDRASTVTGLKTGTPVICGSTDTAMEVYASGASKLGQMTIKVATAGRICIITDKITPDSHLVSYSHLKDGYYYPGTATKGCASSLRWFRDTFSGDYTEFDELAKSVPVGADGLIFHPYINGELTPYGNPNLKGSFVGITATHTKAHFIRSILEGVAMSLLDCKNYLLQRGYRLPHTAFIIGGGAKSKVWRQIISDTLNIKLIETEHSDSSFGSAMLAGVSAGFFENLDDAIKVCMAVKSETVPNQENNRKYNEMFLMYKKTAKALEQIYNA